MPWIIDSARKRSEKSMAQRLAGELMDASESRGSAVKKSEDTHRMGLERAKAVEELKRATVELTLEASARLLKREMRDDDHRRLAREVIDEVVARR